MPPSTSRRKRKESPEQENPLEILLEYLRVQNRPFNEKMLYENLHGAVTKKQITSVLEELIASGDVVRKTYGKQSVVWYNQENIPVLSAEELAELDAKHADLIKQEAALKDKVAKRSASKRAILAVETGGQLEDRKSRLEAKHAEVTAKASDLAATTTLAPSGAIEQVTSKLNAGVREWAKRRTAYTTLIADFADCVYRKPSSIEEEVGIERPVELDARFDDIRTKWG